MKKLWYRVFRLKIIKRKWLQTEIMYFWPYVGKAKMRLRAGSVFNFWRFFLYFSVVCLQFFNWTTASQTHFGFTNMGSEVLSFWVMGLKKGQFWFGSPCNYIKTVRKKMRLIFCYVAPEWINRFLIALQFWNAHKISMKMSIKTFLCDKYWWSYEQKCYFGLDPILQKNYTFFLKIL